MKNKIGKYLRVGDIFEVPLNNDKKAYVQFIGTDPTQLNSDVLRAFKDRYNSKDEPLLEDIVAGKIDFYTHVNSVKFGEEDNIWRKIGRSEDVGDMSKLLFRSTHDWAVNGIVPISDRWQIWRIGGERQSVTSNFDLLNDADIGIVLLPKDVAIRMQTSKYPFNYPGFPGEKKKTSL